MKSELLYAHRFDLPAPVDRCFELFADPNRLDSLTPPWFSLRPTDRPPGRVRAGDEISYRLRWRGLPMRWTSRIVECDPPHLLTYEQVRGPYRFFRHEHRFRSIVGGTEILDQVRYRPYGGWAADALFVRRDLAAIFAFRSRRAVRILELSGARTPVDVADAAREAPDVAVSQISANAGEGADWGSASFIPVTSASSSAIDDPT